jgi:hypothetical protein
MSRISFLNIISISELMMNSKHVKVGNIFMLVTFKFLLVDKYIN